MRSCLIAMALFSAACAPAVSAPSPTLPATPTPTVAATPTASATASPVLSVTASPQPTASAVSDCAARVLATMTLQQRIGQLFLLGLADNKLGATEIDAIRSDHIGSVWFTEKTTIGTSGVRAIADAVQALATTEITGGVRFFVAANQEGGIIQALAGPGFTTIPSALEQSAADPTTLLMRATVWGQQLRAAGVNLNFAPVLDVVPPGTDAQNEPIGVLRRGYGHDPASVGAHGLAFANGMADADIATTVKHFPGLGRVRGNTDVTAAVVDSVTTANDPYLAPFRDAIAAGVPFVMVALATYTQIDASRLAAFSPLVMRDLLRNSLGFDGVVMSDDLGATEAVASLPPAERAMRFLDAGGDLIISKTVAPAREMSIAILQRAAANASFRTRVDDAALRVLRAKVRYSLVSCGS